MNEQLVYKLQCEAACLLKEKVLLLNGITIIPKEIEIYYYEKGSLKTALSIKMNCSRTIKAISIFIVGEQRKQIPIKVAIIRESTWW